MSKCIDSTCRDSVRSFESWLRVNRRRVDSDLWTLFCECECCDNYHLQLNDRLDDVPWTFAVKSTGINRVQVLTSETMEVIQDGEPEIITCENGMVYRMVPSAPPTFDFVPV